MDFVEDRYKKLYCSGGPFKLPKQYIHVQRMYSNNMFNMEQQVAGLWPSSSQQSLLSSLLPLFHDTSHWPHRVQMNYLDSCLTVVKSSNFLVFSAMAVMYSFMNQLSK